jgi:hypothetical protein
MAVQTGGALILKHYHASHLPIRNLSTESRAIKKLIPVQALLGDLNENAGETRTQLAAVTP